MFLRFKNHTNIYLLSAFIILIACKFQEPSKNHGIVFLENRSKKLELGVSNKNDVLKIIGQPHTNSINNNNDWVYIERILTKGEYHKLGQNVLKANNILVLNFDKYGILKQKKIFDKNDIKKIAFSKNETENELTQKSFVEKFLSSVRNKMYGNKD